ncbi:MAG: LysR family transcriptional regulator [Alphaproteobacteria bacterium]|nr:LysR family transcriptional regulator [Alphaproteobacteria bacterium]MBO6863355.1 LysR family transcriptional regulator [Alphaproteobacteria bacterium]
MDRLDELEILNAIVTAGSLRQAAIRLRRSPASVTRALAQMEERFGARLIERTTRRIAPTEAGRRLADQARDVLDGYRALAARTEPEALRGTVRVTAPPYFGRHFLAPEMERFQTTWPEVQVELLLDDRYIDLIDHKLDAALRIGSLADSSLRSRALGHIRWITVCSPDLVREQGVPDHPAALVDLPVVMEPWSSGGPEWRFPIDGKDVPVPLTPRLVSNDIDVQLDAARRGRGFARVYSYHAAADLASGALIRVLPGFDSADIPVQLVTLPGRHAPARTRAVTDHLTRAMRPVFTRLEAAIPHAGYPIE